MKFSFKEAEDVFTFDEALQKKIKENGFVSIYMARLLAGETGKWAVDTCTYSSEEQKHFGWTSMDGREFDVDMFPAAGQYKYVLEMPGSEPIHREIKTGVKLDRDYDDALANIGAEIETLLCRVADLEDRVWKIEHPNKWTWDESPEDASARAAKNRAFLDRVNSWIDSLTGGNS